MRLKKEWLIGGSLELFALALANWQALGGVRTDEAKYLLNIPYPHPPLIRWLMSATEVLPFQEFFWRLFLATLMVQAVWIIWDMTRTFHMEDRMMVCAGWLLSSAVLVQAGSITMAPVMALQTLVFLWLRTRPEIGKRMTTRIGLFWLTTIFTSYPGIFLLPLAWDVLRRSTISFKEITLYLFGPIILLALYTLTNPLELAIILVHGNQGVGTGLSAQAIGFGRLWLIGGAGIASAVGTWGIIKNGDRALTLSFLLICAYIFFSITPSYYAVMLTPFFVAGLWHIFHQRRHPHAFPLLGCLIFASAIITWFAQPARTISMARQTMTAVGGAGTGTVVISGSFGHEWQYESRSPIRRYRPEFAKDAGTIICLNPCEPMFDTTGWKRAPDAPVETWIENEKFHL